MDNETLKWFLSREDICKGLNAHKMAKKAVCLHWALRVQGSG